jgi:hypothetical protein
MTTWLHQLLGLLAQPSLLPEIQICRDDTMLRRVMLYPHQAFRIGRSYQNDFCLDTPLLPMEHFTLLEFHEKGALVQFTSTMRGILRDAHGLHSLEDLKLTRRIHPTPQGYRLQLLPHSSLCLHLGSLRFSIRWLPPHHDGDGLLSPLQIFQPLRDATQSYRQLS